MRKRTADSDGLQEWRGERRSSRIVAKVDGPRSAYDEREGLGEPDERPRKRSRMSSTGSGPDDERPTTGSASGNNGSAAASSSLNKSISGASGIKPHERVVEAVAGKKKSKFWFYAVEGGTVENTNGVNGSTSVTIASPVTSIVDIAPGVEELPESSNGSHKEREYDARSVSSLVNGLKVEADDTAMQE